MESSLLIVSYAIIILSLFFSFFLRNQTSFICSLIAAVFFSDYFAVQFDYIFNGLSLFVIKAWREYLVILMFIVYSKNKYLDSKSSEMLLMNRVPILYLAITLNVLMVFISYFLHHNSLFTIINHSREYFLNIYIVILFVALFDKKRVNFNFVIRFLLFLMVINIMYASFNYFTFNGDYQSSWKYEFKLEREQAKLKEALFGYKSLANDFVRDGNLRASGFFISTLEYGISISLIVLILLDRFKWSNFKGKIIYSVSIFVCIIGIFTSQTRTAFGILILGLVIKYMVLYFKKKKRILVLFPVIFTLLTFLGIFIKLPGVDEASAFGRVIQYAEFVVNFNILGVGLGSSLRSTFDSFYLSVFTVFGLFGIFYFILIFYPFNKLMLVFVNEKGLDKAQTSLFKSIGVIYSVNIFVFSIQYSVSSFQFFLLLLLSFIMASEISQSNIKNDETGIK